LQSNFFAKPATGFTATVAVGAGGVG